MTTYTADQTIALNLVAISRGKVRHDALNYLTQNPAIGMPASYGIGSDSYAMTVVAIDYFKTGAKAGAVKAIYAAHEDHEAEKFTLTKSGRFQKRAQYESYFYGSLTVGDAIEYRDPSF